ncbi:MAG: SDR family oxidoreductase, partial [Pseudomonadota bacterium]
MSGSMAETANFLKELGALPQAERRAAVETAFLAQVGGVLDIDPDFIDGEATLTELGADSLRLITIATRIQDMVGVTIPPNLLPVEASVGEIVDLLTGALGHEDPVASLMESQRRRIVEAMARDIYLHDGTGSATVRVTAEEAANPKRVFLTGATGFLGAYLMRELTEKTNAQIHCLVRAKSAEAGKQRLLGNLEKFNIPSEAIAPRLVVEPGDLGAPLFGLPEERYNELAETVDVVLHNGAAVHLTQHYDLMRGPNVEGTRTMLHFAGLGRMKPTAVISTVGLFDTPELEELPAITETDGPRDPGRLPNGYAQSKWAGERMVEMACALGIPAATLRVG